MLTPDVGLVVLFWCKKPEYQFDDRARGIVHRRRLVRPALSRCRCS